MSFHEVDPDELRSLTEVFRQAGAPEPESWARSQLAEGIPQLALFCFAKALWEGVVREDDAKWISQRIQWAKSRPRDPCAASGPALQEMLNRGVSHQAINDLARVLQYETLFHACTIIDGERIEDVPIAGWVLHQVDDNGAPVAAINGLHEVLLSLDPTGREMRPRESGS